MDIFYTFIEENPNKKENHNIQHQTGRKLVEYAAKNIYEIENTEIEIVNNKPQFKYSEKHFSISHSRNIILVVFDDNPVGADIQYMRKCDYSSIAKRMNFKLEDNTPESFYKTWTQYEAEYKLGQKSMFVYNRVFLTNYYLSLVSAVKNQNIKVERIYFK